MLHELFKRARVLPLIAGILFVMYACGDTGEQKHVEENLQDSGAVKIIGAMRETMHNGVLQGLIDLDTIADKTHLFGLGPMEQLRGEIVIIDGRAFSSHIENNSVLVEESYKVKAPFFVYCNVPVWTEIHLPDSIQNNIQLEAFLFNAYGNLGMPFAFKVEAVADKGQAHIVNLPSGTEVHGPEDVHVYNETMDIAGDTCTIIGFFSVNHQGVFTHHDSYVHMHVLTADHKKMGHCDEFVLKAGTIRLFADARVKLK